MIDRQLNVQLCGFGGQGIVLSAVILGATAVTKAGLNAVQTQSYGSEARGGECQAEVIVSPHEIGSLSADSVDVLVAMSQSALNRYLPRLRQDGTLFYDPEFTQKPDRNDIRIVEVPATKTASDIGLQLAANMVMLGFLQAAIGFSTEDQLLDVVKDNVPARFLNANLEAVRQGAALARDKGVKVEA